MAAVWLAWLVLVVVTISTLVPGVTDAPTVIVRVDVALPSGGGVTAVGLKVPVAPAGSPEMARVTVELKPCRDVTVMLDVPEVP